MILLIVFQISCPQKNHSKRPIVKLPGQGQRKSDRHIRLSGQQLAVQCYWEEPTISNYCESEVKWYDSLSGYSWFDNNVKWIV